MGQWVGIAAAAVAMTTGLASGAHAITLPSPMAAASVSEGSLDLRLGPHFSLTLEFGADAMPGGIEVSGGPVAAQGLRRDRNDASLRAWAGRGQIHLAIYFTDGFALLPTYRFPSLGTGPESERAHRFMVAARWRF